MSIRIEQKQIKCLNCKKELIATVKFDTTSRRITKYLKIEGGDRRNSPIGYTANYCFRCIQELNAIEARQAEAMNMVPQINVGDRIKYTIKPDWGVGEVLKVYDMRLSVYFVNVGGKKISMIEGGQYVIPAENNEKNQPLLDIFRVNYERDGRYNIYVVKLSNMVLREQKFIQANPDRDENKPCLYIGMTGLSPEERFENHRCGHKSSHFPHRYGEKLMPEFYDCFNPMSLDQAKMMEPAFAVLLKRQGFAVWQN